MLRFDRWVDQALYGPDGFYATTGRAGGADGDFLTSVEAGSLFAEVLAGKLDDWWHELGEPDPFVVVEAGAGVGTLCRNLWAAVGDCRVALRYVMVERSDRQREQAFVEVVAEAFSDGAEVPLAALVDLPAGPLTGVVLANELLDNIACRVLERGDGGWSELHIDGDVEVLVPADEAIARMAQSLAPATASGSRIPIQLGGAVWVKRALRLLDHGRLMVFDYGASTATLAERRWTDWARTYRNHRRGTAVLADVGLQDITFDVAVDQLPDSPELATQADWLRSAGIEDLVGAAQASWEQGRSAPTSTTLAARVRLDEAAALLDPAALGGFFVATWTVP